MLPFPSYSQPPARSAERERCRRCIRSPALTSRLDQSTRIVGGLPWSVSKLIAIFASSGALNQENRSMQAAQGIPKAQFWRLLDWLEQRGLADTRFQTSALKLLMFLWLLAYGEPQRNVAHKFLCAQSTVSAVFHTLLPLFVQLFQAFVKQPTPTYLSPEVELCEAGSKFKGFSGCVGALDGTLSNLFLLEREQHQRWRSRHGVLQQNIFAAVYFDRSFAYVLAGAEGSMQDNQLIREALGRTFELPDGRLFLGDSGFGRRRGLLTPFVGERYHLPEVRAHGQPPAKKEELYNLLHASIRSRVEHSFGIVKRKWKIVRLAPAEYDLTTQRDLVYACCGLWNFLVYEGLEPSEGFELEGLTDREKLRMERARQRVDQEIGVRNSIEVRDRIAEYVWAHRR